MLPLDQLVNEVLRLPEHDRAALAAALIDSLDPVSEGDQAGWDAEIRRRIDELDRGVVSPVPWEEARKQIAGSADGDRR